MPGAFIRTAYVLFLAPRNLPQTVTVFGCVGVHNSGRPLIRPNFSGAHTKCRRTRRRPGNRPHCPVRRGRRRPHRRRRLVRASLNCHPDIKPWHRVRCPADRRGQVSAEDRAQRLLDWLAHPTRVCTPPAQSPFSTRGEGCATFGFRVRTRPTTLSEHCLRTRTRVSEGRCGGQLPASSRIERSTLQAL